MNPNVLKALEIMGYGVLAIFIVITILIIVVSCLKQLDKRKSEKQMQANYKPFGEKMEILANKTKSKIKDKFSKKDKSKDNAIKEIKNDKENDVK